MIDQDLQPQIEENDRFKDQETMIQAKFKADLIAKMKKFATEPNISNMVSADLKESLAYRNKMPSNPVANMDRVISFDKSTFAATEPKQT